MAAKKRKKPRPAHRHRPEMEAVTERLRSLDDAARAAVESLAEYLGEQTALQAVIDSLLMSAAAALWHTTALSEEEFAHTARRAFQHIAASHSGCERGQAPEQWSGRREDLN